MLEFTASQPGNSGYHLSLKRQDQNSFRLISTFEGELKSKEIQNEDVLNVYVEIVNAKVFKLKNSYADMNVLDGGTTSFYLKANGREKTIKMRNIVPAELEPVLKQISRLQQD